MKEIRVTEAKLPKFLELFPRSFQAFPNFQFPKKKKKKKQVKLIRKIKN